jgi:hypothetical protein
VTITDTSMTVARKRDQITAEAALTGSTCCAPRPRQPAGRPAVVTAYKNLKYVERDFRHISRRPEDLRPIYHRLEKNASAPTS